MNYLSSYLNNDWANALGWTLLNSLWQGLLIVFLLMITLFFLRKQKAAMRYRIGVSALALLLMVNIFTFVSYSSQTTYRHTKATSSLEILTPASHHFTANDWLIEPSGQSWQTNTFAFFDHYMPLLVLLWLVGMSLLSLRFIGELTVIQYLRHRQVLKAEAHWQQQLEVFSKRLRLHKKVALLQSLRIASPIVVGILEPVILVPLGMLNNLPPKQIKGILAHELAHIKRHDYLVNLLQSLAEVLYFFNPAVWWLSSYIRTEREHCCDDLAIELTGDEINFVKSLAQLEMQRANYSSLAMAWLGNSPGSVLSRIQRVLNQNRQWQLPYRAFSCVGILCLFVLCLAFVQPQSALYSEEPTELEPPLAEEEAAFPASNFDSPEDTKAEPAPSPIHEPVAMTAEQPAVATPSGEQPTIQIADHLAVPDSVPAKARALQKEMRALQILYRQKMSALQGKALAMQKRQHSHEQQVKELEMAYRKKEMELHKKARALHQQQRRQQHTLQKQELEQREKMIELQQKANEIRRKQQQLQVQEDHNSQIESQIKELEKAAQLLEKQVATVEIDHEKQELAYQKKSLEFDRLTQELELQKHVLQQELEEKIYHKELEELEFEKSKQELEFEQQKMEAEWQQKMEKLTIELEKAAQEMEQH